MEARSLCQLLLGDPRQNSCRGQLPTRVWWDPHWIHTASIHIGRPLNLWERCSLQSFADHGHEITL